MSETRVKLAGVDLDLGSWSWPMYRGAYAREITLPLPAVLYDRLVAAVPSGGEVELEVHCSARAGDAAPEMRRTIKGVRVREIRRVNDAGCEVVLHDARGDLASYVCVADINMRWRDGVLPQTSAPRLSDALKLLIETSGAAAHFAANAYAPAQDLPAPQAMPYGGRSLQWAIDDLCNGVDLVCDHHDGKLYFRGRDDITQPAQWPWVAGGEPAWGRPRVQPRLPRLLRYRYLHRSMIALHMTAGRSVATLPDYPTAEQIYFDDGMRGTTATGYLTGQELFDKYAPGVAYDDDMVGRHVMSPNFDGSPIPRDGSRDRDILIRILQRDWCRLFRVVMPNGQPWGAWTDLSVGVFAVDGGQHVADLLATGARGAWAEFLSVVDGGGPGSINAQRVFTNHTGSPYPTMPFSARFESESDGILRLEQQVLPDDNVAMPGTVRNEADMVIHMSGTAIPLPGGGAVTRWLWRVPTRQDAQLQPREKLLIIVGTKRLPNNAQRYHTVEMPGFSDGGIPVQEFEVSDLPALFDHRAVLGTFDAQMHTGQLLNPRAIQDDASARAADFRRQHSRRQAGQGIAAGIAALAERVDGSVSEMRVVFEGAVVTTVIARENLAPSHADIERARRRAEFRAPEVGGIRRLA